MCTSQNIHPPPPHLPDFFSLNLLPWIFQSTTTNSTFLPSCRCQHSPKHADTPKLTHLLRRDIMSLWLGFLLMPPEEDAPTVFRVKLFTCDKSWPSREYYPWHDREHVITVILSNKYLTQQSNSPLRFIPLLKLKKKKKGEGVCINNTNVNCSWCFMLNFIKQLYQVIIF